MKKVSVLIPLFNCETYISEAIDSVLGQTYQNIEVIIVDDGSTDTSLQVAKGYESEKVKVFTLSHGRAPRARNFAFKQSTGDYIQYLDADDLLAPNKIEEHVKILEEHGNNCLVFCSYTRNYNDFIKGKYIAQEVNKDYLNPLELFLDLFHSKGDVLFTSWLFPRTLIQHSDPMNEQLVKFIDSDFTLKIALKCHRLIYCKNTLVFYRATGSSRITTNQGPDAIRSGITAAESMQEVMLKHESSDRVNEALITLYSHIYCSYFNKTNAIYLRKVEMHVEELGGSLKFIGNKYFGLLAKIIGVKTALLIKTRLKTHFKYLQN
jgi:glycosyltransferase involved in cell wall biosynthesis